MTRQKLNCSQIASLAVDFRRFGPAERMGAVTARLQPDCRHPIAYDSAVLARRYVWPVVKATWEHITAREHLWGFDPGQYRLTCVFRQFKLNRSLRLTLDNGNTLPNTIIFHEISHTQFDEITTAQLAVDGDVEQSQVPQIACEF